MAKFWKKPTDLKELNYALWEFSIKGNDTNKNIKFAKNICVSRCVETRKNQNENYNTVKTLLFAKTYEFVKIFLTRPSLLELDFIKVFFIQIQITGLKLQMQIPHLSFQFHNTDPLQQIAGTRT